MRKTAVVLFLFVLLTISHVAMAQTADQAPTIRGRVTPGSANTATEFLFTSTYTDKDNDTPLFVRVVIDGSSYEMDEVNPSDDNYTDGKDYQFRKFMPAGASAFYYTSTDGNHTVSTSVLTLTVYSNGLVGGEHYDLILFGSVFMPVFLVLVAYVILQVRGIRKTLENIAKKDEDQSE